MTIGADGMPGSNKDIEFLALVYAEYERRVTAITSKDHDQRVVAARLADIFRRRREKVFGVLPTERDPLTIIRKQFNIDASDAKSP